jgi:hypothetical protein
MRDDELGLIMTRLAPTLSDGERSAAEDFAAASHTLRRASRRRPRRGWIVAGAAAGLLMLFGAGSLAAYQLGVPPYQTIPEGIQRIHDGIPVDYRDADGATRHCLMFLEFENLSATEFRRVEAYLGSTNWSGYGQAIANEVGPAQEAMDERVMTAVGADLRDRVRTTFPNIEVDDPRQAAERGVPLLAGSASTCREPESAE